jgi:hypothetical protein
VMPFVAAQERHEIAQPVAEAKTQHIAAKLHGCFRVGRMQDDMADLLRWLKSEQRKKQF